MIEPIYSYVKGSGWIVQATPTCEHSEVFYFKNEAAQNVYPARFEFRRPQTGEYYDAAAKDSGYFRDGNPFWYAWLRDYSGRHLDTLHLKAKPNTHYSDFDLYVTLVLL